MTGIEYIKNAVVELLKNNSNGHDDKHVFRVYYTAMKFCDEIPLANRNLVAAAALLHDCDDYKLTTPPKWVFFLYTKNFFNIFNSLDLFCVFYKNKWKLAIERNWRII